ncbi:MAG: hypothetical protein V4548_04870 [Bacteroidota bacterium]
MRNYLVLIIVFIGTSIFAQSQPKWESQFRFEFIRPIAFGNNSISKSHDNKSGFGFNWSLIEYEKFRLGFGSSFITFGVIDKSKAGNFDRTNYNTISGVLSYDYKINDKFILVPYISIGGVTLKQRATDIRNSTQDGTEYKIGLHTDYKLGKSFVIYSKVSYAYSKLNITTAPEYEKFFGQAQQIQIAIGLKL